MICDSERTLTLGIFAALYLIFVPVEVQGLIEGLQVAAMAHVRAIEADVCCDVAAETALVVDELLAVAGLVTLFLTDTKLF